MQIPYLSTADLDALGLSTADVIAGIEQVIIGQGAGTVWAAPKAAFATEDGRYMMAALGAMDDPDLLAVKTVVLNPANPGRDLPLINGLVTLLNSDTGEPLGLLDGNWITAVRTAGLSAVAAKYLCRADAVSIGFVGCGVQAQSHLTAFAEMFPLRQMTYFGRGAPNKARLAAAAKALGLETAEAPSAKAAIQDVDIVVTTVPHTSDSPPYLDAATMKAGSFAAIVDLAAPWQKDSFGALDKVAVDDLRQEEAMPTKLANPADLTGDLTGLVTGTSPARATPEERTAFVFRGHGLGDLGLSQLAWRRHAERAL